MAQIRSFGFDTLLRNKCSAALTQRSLGFLLIEQRLKRCGETRSDIRILGSVKVIVNHPLFSAKTISDFINKRPTLKILALSFLLLIGFSLLVEGIHYDIPKGYIYFTMAFSMFVELINLRVRAKSQPVKLHQAYQKE